jgi:hypothetical protein
MGMRSPHPQQITNILTQNNSHGSTNWLLYLCVNILLETKMVWCQIIHNLLGVWGARDDSLSSSLLARRAVLKGRDGTVFQIKMKRNGIYALR